MNGKKLWLKTLVDSDCIYTEVDKQLVKKERIKTEPIDRSFKVFNTDETKNREVTWFVLLELEINRHTEHIDAVVTNLNDTDMFPSQNKLLTYLWYLNLGCIFRGLGVIQKFKNDDNNDEDQYKCQ